MIFFKKILLLLILISLASTNLKSIDNQDNPSASKSNFVKIGEKSVDIAKKACLPWLVIMKGLDNIAVASHEFGHAIANKMLYNGQGHEIYLGLSSDDTSAVKVFNICNIKVMIYKDFLNPWFFMGTGCHTSDSFKEYKKCKIAQNVFSLIESEYKKENKSEKEIHIEQKLICEELGFDYDPIKIERIIKDFEFQHSRGKELIMTCAGPIAGIAMTLSSLIALNYLKNSLGRVGNYALSPIKYQLYVSLMWQFLEGFVPLHFEDRDGNDGYTAWKCLGVPQQIIDKTANSIDKLKLPIALLFCSKIGYDLYKGTC